MISRVSVGRSTIALAVVCVALGGCARACKNEHPYVPAEPTKTTAVVDASAPPIAADASFGATLEAVPGTTTIDLEGTIVSMPEREIVLAMIGDMNGDGAQDALAIVRPPAPPEGRAGTTSGELVSFHARAPDPVVVARGPTIGVDPTCVPVARLERAGPSMVFAEIGASCTKTTATRSLTVTRVSIDPFVRFEASISDPPGAPRLAVRADEIDRDEDGPTDVVLTVTLDGVAAKLAYLERRGDALRDIDEPEQSLSALATRAAKSAGKAKEAAVVPPLVGQIRALYRALCLEGGAPRFTPKNGPIACGPSKALDDAGIAEVRAWATLGDPLRAFAAAAELTPRRATELGKTLATTAPSLDAKTSRTLNVLADEPKPQPEWGALAFESNAKLLVRHGEKVSRVDLSTWEQEDTNIPAWPAHVVAPDGKERWLEAYNACDGVALRSTFALVTEGDVADVQLPIAPRLGTKCAGGKGEPVTAIPVAWSSRGLEAIVAGQPVMIDVDKKTASLLPTLSEDAPARGSPRSANGKAITIPTAQGVLVRAADKWTLRRGSDLAPYTELRGCTTTDDGTIVACQKKGRIVVASF